MVEDERQEMIDTFYWRHGPCCGGCDWWRSLNSRAGECTRRAPIAGAGRAALLGIENCSLHLGAGHPLTPREHHCGDFQDNFDWSTLPRGYRKRIGAPTASATP